MSATLQVGQMIGPSEWVTVDQAMISGFGAVTLDPDPMHDDPEWAAANSPFGGTIGYGFLTIALLSHLIRSSIELEAAGHHLNYGFNRLRLIAPVPVGARVRGTFRVASIEQDGPRETLTYAVTVEIEGQDRPALVADWLTVKIAEA